MAALHPSKGQCDLVYSWPPSVMAGNANDLKYAMAHWLVDRQEMWMLEDMWVL